MRNGLKINSNNIIKISTLNNEGIDKLQEKIKEIFNLEQIDQKDLTYLTNARSIALLKEAILNIKEVEKGLDNNIPTDIIEIDIKNAWSNLGKIIGETYDEEILDDDETEDDLKDLVIMDENEESEIA